MTELKKPIVINLFAGPGTGKSTSCAQIFAELKQKHVNCEMVREFAKDKVWENSIDVLNDQIYIFGKQQHKMRVLIGNVDVIVTDSPILLSLIYDKSGNQNFRNLVHDVHKEFTSINFLLEREKPFNPKGRLQNEEKARLLDIKIKDLLNELNVPFTIKKTNQTEISEISEIVLRALDAQTEYYHAK